MYIGIDGPIDDLTPTLRSEPSLSYQEILGLITTGRTDLSSFSNDPLRSGFDTAASLITDQLFSKPVQKETQALGISRFQIDPVLRPNQIRRRVRPLASADARPSFHLFNQISLRNRTRLSF